MHLVSTLLTIRVNIAVNLAADDQLRQGQGLVLFVVQAQVSIAGPQPAHGHDPLSRHRVAGHVDHVESKEGQLRKAKH